MELTSVSVIVAQLPKSFGSLNTQTFETEDQLQSWVLIEPCFSFRIRSSGGDPDSNSAQRNIFKVL